MTFFGSGILGHLKGKFTLRETLIDFLTLEYTLG